jgi:hypothetical protein
VYYRKELSEKGFNGMTIEEKEAWLGNPLDAVGANLFSCGPYYSSAVEVKYRSEDIVATATADGIYLYAISVIGEATNFANKVFTLSAESIIASGDGTPMIALYWHDDNGYEYAGADLLSAGSVTFDTATMPNVNNRKYLAAYIYVTTHESVVIGESARFVGVMLENGDTRHEYVPYAEILATDVTKGAYNFSDLNRVGRAVEEISDYYDLVLISKTDWKMWDIPTETEMNRYIGNISAIWSMLTDTTNIPKPPTTMNNLTYEVANNIELILEAAYKSVVW